MPYKEYMNTGNKYLVRTNVDGLVSTWRSFATKGEAWACIQSLMAAQEMGIRAYGWDYKTIVATVEGQHLAFVATETGWAMASKAGLKSLPWAKKLSDKTIADMRALYLSQQAA